MNRYAAHVIATHFSVCEMPMKTSWVFSLSNGREGHEVPANNQADPNRKSALVRLQRHKSDGEMVRADGYSTDEPRPSAARRRQWHRVWRCWCGYRRLD